MGMLDGVRIVDLCHFLAGPYAAAVLGDLGASVVKVEDKDHLDEARFVGDGLETGRSYYFQSLNRNKRSFCVNVRDPRGRELLLRLVAQSDVVLDNFRPGVMKRLGLDHDALTSANPSIITCSLTGYGESGPYRDRAGYDYTIQALAGVMALTGEPDGPPGKAGISYVDHAGGLTAALAIAAALVERARTGAGRHLDVGLFDVQISMLTYLAAWQLNLGVEPQRVAAGGHPVLVPAQTFPAADGWLSIFVGNDAMWARFVDALGDPDLGATRFADNAGRAAHRDEVVDRVARIVRQRPVAHWVGVFNGAGVSCAPVNSLAEALCDPQVAARSLVVEETTGDRYVRGPLPMLAEPVSNPAPAVGEHTLAILRELGVDRDEIDALAASGAIGIRDGGSGLDN